jgi:transcriptional antiterminator NusG
MGGRNSEMLRDAPADRPEDEDDRVMAKRWYSVSVLSNFEKKVAEQIRASVAENGLEDQIDEVLVPTEEVIEVRRGKKVSTERRFMPGYVLVHMEMSDQGYHLINTINRVTGFLGPQGRPMPMRDAEVNQILNRVQEGEEAPRTLISFEIGERVKVNDGPFEGFDGMVEGVDDDSQKLRVSVSIFGRETPVELDFTQVAKQG